MAHDVFISYATKDKVIADAVCAALEADHIRCYIAPRDVLPGQRYAQALVDAIHSARAFVLVLSAASNASNQVEREVDRAVSCGLPILPLRVEDVMPCDWLEYYLAGQHWLDALTPPLEAHLMRLSEAIGVLLQPPAAGGRPPLADEWRGGKPAATKPAGAKPMPPARASAKPAASAPPTAAPPPGAEKPAEAKRPLEYVPPRAAPGPGETARPIEAVKPAVAEPSKVARPPESKPEAAPAVAEPGPATTVKPAPPLKPAATAAAATPVSTRPAAAAKPMPSAATASAAAAPAATPKAVAAAPPARKGRRTAVIAAAVVGVSWIGVLLAVELLFR